jgi:hypothetical protein
MVSDMINGQHEEDGMLTSKQHAFIAALPSLNSLAVFQSYFHRALP